MLRQKCVPEQEGEFGGPQFGVGALLLRARLGLDGHRVVGEDGERRQILVRCGREGGG